MKLVNVLLSTSCAAGGGKSVEAVIVKVTLLVTVDGGVSETVNAVIIAAISQRIPATVPGSESTLAYGIANASVTIAASLVLI